MRKPIIGITTDAQLPDGNRVKSGRYYVSSAYISSVEMADGIPIMLPVSGNDAVVLAHANMIDGLILCGGVDVNPLMFGEQPHQKLMEVCSERDWYEQALIREIMLQAKPIFGICRGVQMLNVACGGTLWQDIYTANPNVLKHRQDMGGHSGSHTVQMKSGSLMQKCLTDNFVTNSFHHQACKQLAPEFIATAWTTDGIIEAIEKPGETLTFGVQWHPEHMTVSQPQMLTLFRELTAAAKNRMELN
ncbi:MAG: gamma-glutamyl-gamma-aminobutyrate hydrolase family protein [Bacillota bacterium]